MTTPDEAKRLRYNEKCREWANENRGKIKSYQLKAEYGLSLEEYRNMQEAQGFSCAICGISLPQPHVDHDHATGNVRGLLCGQCNRGLGNFKDSTQILAGAIEYLNIHASCHSASANHQESSMRSLKADPDFAHMDEETLRTALAYQAIQDETFPIDAECAIISHGWDIDAFRKDIVTEYHRTMTIYR